MSRIGYYFIWTVAVGTAAVLVLLSSLITYAVLADMTGGYSRA